MDISRWVVCIRTAEVQERVSATILLILNSFMQGMTKQEVLDPTDEKAAEESEKLECEERRYSKRK